MGSFPFYCRYRHVYSGKHSYSSIFPGNIIRVLRIATVPAKVGEAVVGIPAYTVILFVLGRAVEKFVFNQGKRTCIFPAGYGK